jgi:hypothetical protein
MASLAARRQPGTTPREPKSGVSIVQFSISPDLDAAPGALGPGKTLLTTSSTPRVVVVTQPTDAGDVPA